MPRNSIGCQPDYWLPYFGTGVAFVMAYQHRLKCWRLMLNPMLWIADCFACFDSFQSGEVATRMAASSVSCTQHH
jgi:hypothetical protein